MVDNPIDFTRGKLTVSTDRGRLDLDAALALLQTTSWAKTMTRKSLERAIANSVTFAVYDDTKLIGLGRAVTDLATYAYYTDIVIAAKHRGVGIGQWLVECMLAHPDLQGLRRIALLTRDARALYERFGFVVDTGVNTYMELKPGPSAA